MFPTWLFFFFLWNTPAESREAPSWWKAPAEQPRGWAGMQVPARVDTSRHSCLSTLPAHLEWPLCSTWPKETQVHPQQGSWAQPWAGSQILVASPAPCRNSCFRGSPQHQPILRAELPTLAPTKSAWQAWKLLDLKFSAFKVKPVALTVKTPLVPRTSDLILLFWSRLSLKVHELCEYSRFKNKKNIF